MPSKAEFEHMLASNPAALQSLMEALPAHAKKQIGLKWAATELEDEFTKADSNADGSLSWSEFRVWASQAIGRGGGAASPAQAPPTAAQLKALFITSFVPFVGFGMADNTMMVLTGDAIDGSLGLALGLSTMAAAALGNSISNGLGMVLHGTIERYMIALGMPDPRLTSVQSQMRAVKNVKVVAGITGVVTGCLLGMWPLLFLDAGRSDRGEKSADGEAEATPKRS